MIRKNKNRVLSYKIHMFSEDISNAIQFSIPEYRNNRQNIKIENLDKNSEENFEDYFKYNDPMYLDYDFLKELARTIVTTILKGIGIAQIIKYKDDYKNIKGIEIRNIDYIFKIKVFYYTFLLIKYPYLSENKYKIRIIKNKEAIFIKRKKFKISSYKTRKLLRKISRDNDYDVLELIQNNLLLHGDYEKITVSKKVNLFKSLNEIKWDGRNDCYEFLNLPYVLYRQVQFRNFLLSVLNITLNLINKQILKQKDIAIKR